jgi:hypothetical protein
MNEDYGGEAPICCRCGARASEYEPRSMSCFCRKCALELADVLLLELREDEKLECARFESLSE